MDGWLDELLAALRNVELRLDRVGGTLLPVRPDPARERARREWRETMNALGTVLEQVEGGHDLCARAIAAARSSLAVELLRGDEMRRRDLLRFTGMFSAAAILPADLRARVAGTPTRVDSGVLDAHAQATASYARGYYTAAPGDLLGVVRSHVNQLAALGHVAMAPELFQRWGSLTSDAAALAGWLALDADRRGESRAYFGLARDAAQEAGNQVLHALAVASIGAYHDAQHGGDPRDAVRYLRRALAELPYQAPDYARTWLHAQTAKEEAATGNAYAFARAIEHLDQARARSDNAGVTPGPFWSTTGWFSYLELPGWRDDHHARGLAYLGNDDAGDALQRLLAAATDQRTRARLNVFLADWHLRRDEPVEAAAVAAEALGGTPQWNDRVRTLRGCLDPYRDLSAVRDLDEALALAA